MPKMPKQKPGKSFQAYQTPPEFLAAVRSLLDIDDFACDLAASPENAVCLPFYTESQDALQQPWLIQPGGWNWCNPPFAHIEPWVRKAWTEQIQFGTQTAMLLPAGVGSNWWREWVHGKAQVLLLNGRLSFDGVAPYPKDCVLLLYSPVRVLLADYNVWQWQKDPVLR